MLLQFDLTINSELSDSIIASVTWPGLGVSKQSVVLPSELDFIPSVFIMNDGQRRLFPDNITVNGCDILGDEIGQQGPPYNITVELSIPDNQSL